MLEVGRLLHLFCFSRRNKNNHQREQDTEQVVVTGHREIWKGHNENQIVLTILSHSQLVIFSCNH